jgi:hypothetical protein
MYEVSVVGWNKTETTPPFERSWGCVKRKLKKDEVKNKQQQKMIISECIKIKKQV